MTDFKTGDLLLFKGNGLISTFITALPGADFSHVAFFYDHEILGPCVFESTSIGNDPDVFTGEIICGVQVTKFEDRVAHYDGEVYVRHLKEPLTEDQTKKFTDLIKTWHGVPYEQDNIQLMRAELDLFPWQCNEPDESSMFCSELATRIVRDINLVEDNGEPTNESTPTDCAEKWTDAYQPVGTEPLFTTV